MDRDSIIKKYRQIIRKLKIDYDEILADWLNAGKTEADMLDPTTGDATALSIKEMEKTCSGWVCSANGEIESFYRSLGVRVGINARF